MRGSRRVGLLRRERSKAVHVEDPPDLQTDAGGLHRGDGAFGDRVDGDHVVAGEDEHR